MNKSILGAMLTAGLVFGMSTLGLSTTGFAAGDGLDRDAAATGNSTFAGQHRNAAGGAMMAPRSGRAMMAPRGVGRHATRHRHHRRHR